MAGDRWGRSGGSRGQLGVDEVRAKLLHGGTQHVETFGLTLGIDAAFCSDLARSVGVTPKQFAKVWASPEAFLADLFCELANQAQIDRADSETLTTTWQYLSMRIDDLRSPEGRRRILIDVIRTAAEYNFDVVTASNKWRTYAALSTTIMSWPEGGARTRVIDALRASEMAFVETMESFYRNVLPTVGYRLKPMFANNYQPFVVAAASVIEGLGIVRTTVPALVEAKFQAQVDGNADAWSVASLAFIGVVDAFIEPDPSYDSDEAISRLNGGIDVTPRDDLENTAGQPQAL